MSRHPGSAIFRCSVFTKGGTPVRDYATVRQVLYDAGLMIADSNNERWPYSGEPRSAVNSALGDWWAKDREETPDMFYKTTRQVGVEVRTQNHVSYVMMWYA